SRCIWPNQPWESGEAVSWRGGSTGCWMNPAPVRRGKSATPPSSAYSPGRWKRAARRHALVHAFDSPALRVEPERGQPHLARFCPQPHRAETFQLSKDPLFIEKVRDIVGLYLAPPDKALVLCVDEKTQIQALDRSQP